MPKTKTRSPIPALFFLLALLALPGAVLAGSIAGRVVGVHDGDTLTMLDATRQQHKIRLAEIDAPESRQPYGSRSKQSLSDLVYGRAVVVEVIDRDRYGRTVGRVLVDGRSANAEQVHLGMAWVYRQYLRDASLIAIEDEARRARRGLWADADPVAPWDWRRQKRQGDGRPAAQASAPPAKAAASTGFSCSHARTTCGQMASCSEAEYHLRQCGISRLDRDGDGIPCESLCRR